jgi:N-acetylneuraminic acid mutarotase
VALIGLAGCAAAGRAHRPPATSSPAAGSSSAGPASAGPAAISGTPAPSVASATVTRLGAGHWLALPRAPITPRDGASVVWTGRELLVWGGQSGSRGDHLHADGAAYDPGSDRWRLLPAAPLAARTGQAAVWTGTEMIIWGGYDQVSARASHVTSSGAAYDPATNRWTRLPKAPLSPRADAIASWTGSAVLILGGQPAVTSNAVRGYRDGAKYSPALGRWQHIAPPAPPSGHPLTWRTAVWAGRQLFAFSEWAKSRRTGPDAYSESGGVDLFAHSPDTGRWRLVPPSPGMLPDAEEVLLAGQLVVVRGSTYNCGLCPGPFVPEATNLFNPAANSWTRVPADPLAGDGLVSAWTGAALFSFNPGGEYGSVRPGDASAYDVAARRWTRLPAAPFGCDTTQSPAWTGREVLFYCARPPSGRGAGHDGLAFAVRS